jgi:hypothetical protein
MVDSRRHAFCELPPSKDGGFSSKPWATALASRCTGRTGPKTWTSNIRVGC